MPDFDSIYVKDLLPKKLEYVPESTGPIVKDLEDFFENLACEGMAGPANNRFLKFTYHGSTPVVAWTQ